MDCESVALEVDDVATSDGSWHLLFDGGGEGDGEIDFVGRGKNECREKRKRERGKEREGERGREGMRKRFRSIDCHVY